MENWIVKIMAVLLSVSMLLSFVGCDSKPVLSGNGSGGDPTTPAPTDPADCAVRIGGYEVSAPMMNYFFMEAIKNERSAYGDYAFYFLPYDVTRPLNAQIFNEETGDTWADYYLYLAIEQAKAIYGVCAQAEAAGFQLTESYENYIQSQVSSMGQLSQYYYNIDLDDYLSLVYGEGANTENYTQYLRNQMIAVAYYEQYRTQTRDSYTKEQIQAYDAEHMASLSRYNFYTYAVNYSSFLEGGTENQDGTIVYSEEEKERARQTAAAVADSLMAATTVEEFQTMVSQLPYDVTKECSHNTDIPFSSIGTEYGLWLSDPARQPGDMQSFPVKYTQTTESGNSIEVVNSYLVMMYESTNENLTPLANVRHLLVAFSGGTQDSSGNTVYSDAEKETARNKAEQLLSQYLTGEQTEDAFIALVKAHTEDEASKESGGLYTDICEDSSYVEGFKNWAVSNVGNIGATGIVETTYGYHIMYYASDSETTYRQYLATEAMLSADIAQWEENMSQSMTAEQVDISGILMDVIWQPAS